MITADTITARQRKAGALALKFKRRNVRLSVADAVGEALLAMLVADQSFVPGMGVPREAYAYRAAVQHVTGFMWKSTCPVHLTDYALHKEQRSSEQVSRVSDWSLDDTSETEFGNDRRRAFDRRFGDVDVEVEFDRGRLRTKVRELMHTVEPDERVAFAALSVIVGEGTAKEEAQKLGVPPARIRATTENLRAELMSRPDLWKLWLNVE